MSRSRSEDPSKSLRLLFAKNLRLARIAAGMSQEALADLATLDRTFIGTVERGVRNVSIDNVQRLATAVGKIPQDLLDPSFAVRFGLDESVTRVPRSIPTHKVQSKRSRTRK